MQGPNDMQPASASRPSKLTYQDYLEFPDDGLRHELIDGEHFVTPAPNVRHQRIVKRLVVAFELHLREYRLGEVIASPMDVILSDFDVLEPDVLFVSNERSGIVRDWVHGAPDLAVEILSPSTRATDERKKRDVYERFGVREYWIVDPEHDRVTIHRRDASGRFGVSDRLTREAGDILGTPLLPAFALPLSELFA